MARSKPTGLVKILCGCFTLLCLIFLVLIILGLLAIVGFFAITLEGMGPCIAIGTDQSFITPMQNVSVKPGVLVTAECKVVNFEPINAHERVYWIGPKFEAGIGSGQQYTLYKDQLGVVVSGEEYWDSYVCWFGRATAHVRTFTLQFRATLDQVGWYTCKTVTNYTQFSVNSEKKFYLALE